MPCLDCFKIKNNNNKKDNKTPIFLLYCFECNKYFDDEKKYNEHLRKFHNEKL
jgi:hypothetical protein|tara:strand:- start:4336 stop:4494 length:159 start_codon:yes stop_codon:yes gene_type:complete